MESRETNTSLSLSRSLALSERSYEEALFEKKHPSRVLSLSLSSDDDDGCARQKKGKKKAKRHTSTRAVSFSSGGVQTTTTRRARAQKERATPNRRIITTTTRVQYTSFLETSRQRQLCPLPPNLLAMRRRGRSARLITRVTQKQQQQQNFFCTNNRIREREREKDSVK